MFASPAETALSSDSKSESRDPLAAGTVATPMEDEGEELMETDDLETSICDNLLVRGRQTSHSSCGGGACSCITFDPSLPQNIHMTITNPETGCVYYEQYCIDNDYFRLGKSRDQ